MEIGVGPVNPSLLVGWIPFVNFQRFHYVNVKFKSIEMYFDGALPAVM